MRVAFAGTPEFALPALSALHAHHQIVGVLTQPDRPSGRGRRLTASPVKQAALALGLPIAQPATLKDEAVRVQLGSWQPEVLVVVAMVRVSAGEPREQPAAAMRGARTNKLVN